MDARADGLLGLSPGGCVTIAGAVLVAPEGSTVDGKTLKIPGQSDRRIGERATFGGGFMRASDAVAGLGTCRAAPGEVFVVNPSR